MALTPRLAGRLFNQPLAVLPSFAQSVLQIYGPRMMDNPVSVHGELDAQSQHAGRLGDPMGQRLQAWGDDAVRRIDGIGYLCIEGVLVNKGKFIGQYCGETSYEGLWTQTTEARRDDSIKAVIVEVDSPGGEVDGLFDFAEELHALGQEKPTIAILTDMAASAAYLLASACGAIVMPSTGVIGSIGAMTMHADLSSMYEKAGVVVTPLFSGEHKVDGNPFAALPTDVADRIRADLDATRDVFCASVGRYRPNFGSDAAKATEAQVYRGPEALKLGLCDAVGRPSEAAEAFVKQVLS